MELNGRPIKFGTLQPQHFSDLDNIELGTWERLLGNLGKARLRSKDFGVNCSGSEKLEHIENLRRTDFQILLEILWNF